MTQSVTDDVRLRPLSIGEIFDRSLTLFIRNLPSFLIVAAFVAVPLGFMQYGLASINGTMLQQIAAQSKNASASASLYSNFPPQLWLGAVLTLFIQPFMYVATASLVGRIYRNEPRDWRAAYGVALRHTGGILLTILSAFGVYVAGVVTFVIAVVIIAIPLAFAGPWVAGTGIAIASAAFFIVLFVAFLAIALTFNAIGIDEMPFGRAIGQSFGHVFSRGEFKKAVLIVLAFAAVEIGIFLLSMGIQMIAEGAVHLPLLDAALSATLSLFTMGFFGVLIAVYYFDVRVRREGLDLQAALDAIQTPAQQ